MTERPLLLLSISDAAVTVAVVSDGYSWKDLHKVAFTKIQGELNVSVAQSSHRRSCLKDGFQPAPEYHQQIRKAPSLSVNTVTTVAGSAEKYDVFCFWHLNRVAW